jgi:hypothetical protein
VLVLRSSSVTGNLRQLSHPRSLLLGVALSLEALSILAYALMIRRLLERGGLATRTLPLVRMTLAGIAMSAPLPGGTAASTLYWFRELRHEGAERAFRSSAALTHYGCGSFPARSRIPRSIFWLIAKLSSSVGSTMSRAHARV